MKEFICDTFATIRSVNGEGIPFTLILIQGSMKKEELRELTESEPDILRSTYFIIKDNPTTLATEFKKMNGAAAVLVFGENIQDWEWLENQNGLVFALLTRFIQTGDLVLNRSSADSVWDVLFKRLPLKIETNGTHVWPNPSPDSPRPRYFHAYNLMEFLGTNS